MIGFLVIYAAGMVLWSLGYEGDTGHAALWMMVTCMWLDLILRHGAPREA